MSGYRRTNSRVKRAKALARTRQRMARHTVRPHLHSTYNKHSYNNNHSSSHCGLDDSRAQLVSSLDIPSLELLRKTALWIDSSVKPVVLEDMLKKEIEKQSGESGLSETNQQAIHAIVGLLHGSERDHSSTRTNSHTEHFTYPNHHHQHHQRPNEEPHYHTSHQCNPSCPFYIPHFHPKHCCDYHCPYYKIYDNYNNSRYAHSHHSVVYEPSPSSCVSSSDDIHPVRFLHVTCTGNMKTCLCKTCVAWRECNLCNMCGNLGENCCCKPSSPIQMLPHRPCSSYAMTE